MSSLHRDSFVVPASGGVPGLNPVLASANTNALYCRAVSCKANLHRIRSIPGLCQHSSKSFTARPCNRPVAVKHMLLCPPGLRHLDKFIIA